MSKKKCLQKHPSDLNNITEFLHNLSVVIFTDPSQKL